MNARIIRPALLGAVLFSFSALPAFAAQPEPTAFALPTGLLALEVTPLVTDAAPEVGFLHTPAVPAVEMTGVHYRPRRGGAYRNSTLASVSQIHVGFYDPDGDPARQFLVGIRGGPMLDPHIQLGVGLDWAHDSDHASSVASRETGPGGVPITVQREIARSSTDFFPIMAFLQVSADDNMSIVPYFGAAAGYQLLNLSAEDYQTGDSFDATYGGWGWQLWGGAAVPLSGRTRLTGELFVNGGEVGRDVDDPLFGGYRETVDADGVGARIGLAWGF